MKKDYKQKILDFYKDNKRMPVYTEIMKLVGFKSKNAVHKLVNKLVAEDVISKDSFGRLIPNMLYGEIPMLGLVEAGFPTVAEESVLDTINLDDYLIKDKQSTYLLTVKGDSMIDAGIQEGDIVIAEKKKEPKVGDIVTAEVDGGWTMKYFRKDSKTGKVFLEPANKKYKPIYPETSFDIAAIVRGVIRRY